MAYAGYNVLAEAAVEVTEKTRIMIQMAENKSTQIVSLSLNKQWRDEAGRWQWGKGFQIPQEQTVEFLQKICEVMGLEVQFAIDSD